MYNKMVLFENFRTNKKLDFVNFTALYYYSTHFLLFFVNWNSQML